MDRLSRLIALLLSWVTVADRATVDPISNPVLTSGARVDLTLHCEGDIGDRGSDSGTAGGASGNPSDSDGGGGGGGGGSSGPSLGSLTKLGPYVDTLVSFASSPISFLRGRAIPPILGAIFGFAFDIANIVARPFDAVLGSLDLVSDSLSTATQAVSDPIGDVLAVGAGTVLSLTAPLGPLQPFAATILTLIIAYVVLIAGIRLARAIADSIPVVSGVETFLFG